MKLHYSQTQLDKEFDKALLNYHMKLHYSQTSNYKNRGRIFNATTRIVIHMVDIKTIFLD